MKSLLELIKSNIFTSIGKFIVESAHGRIIPSHSIYTVKCFFVVISTEVVVSRYKLFQIIAVYMQNDNYCGKEAHVLFIFSFRFQHEEYFHFLVRSTGSVRRGARSNKGPTEMKHASRGVYSKLGIMTLAAVGFT